ncbi:hypothetical protein J6590_036041 [Homalodisca vitripennis]|nr:hypothetical protein J6590_036041 [Homalodisca vitripennis]
MQGSNKEEDSCSQGKYRKSFLLPSTKSICVNLAFGLHSRFPKIQRSRRASRPTASTKSNDLQELPN